MAWSVTRICITDPEWVCGEAAMYVRVSPEGSEMTWCDHFARHIYVNIPWPWPWLWYIYTYIYIYIYIYVCICNNRRRQEDIEPSFQSPSSVSQWIHTFQRFLPDITILGEKCNILTKLLLRMQKVWKLCRNNIITSIRNQKQKRQENTNKVTQW